MPVWALRVVEVGRHRPGRSLQGAAPQAPGAALPEGRAGSVRGEGLGERYERFWRALVLHVHGGLCKPHADPLNVRVTAGSTAFFWDIM